MASANGGGSASSSAAVDAAGVKRGRGRPRKNAAAPEAPDETDDAQIDRMLLMLDDLGAAGEQPAGEEAGEAQALDEILESDRKRPRKHEKKKKKHRDGGSGEDDAAQGDEAPLVKADPKKQGQVEKKAKSTFKFAADPDDSRLTVEGAALDVDGKVALKQYSDLTQIYLTEPDREGQPDPAKPGVREEELDDVDTTDMHPWSDAKGAGWIVKRNVGGRIQQSRYVSARSLFSWRLAFLLARLQREVWKARDAQADAPVAKKRKGRPKAVSDAD